MAAQTLPVMSTDRSLSMPALLIKAESLAIMLSAVAFYARFEGNWLLFIGLLFAPDLSALGYLTNPRLGSIVYNMVHTYAAPILLAALALTMNSSLALQLALIWFTHIGMDRLMGFGLKYPTAFKDTHLQRI
jgi:hypothetical protein